MQAPKFEKLFDQLALLNQPQRQQVLAALHPAAGLDRVIALISDHRSKGRRCPDCTCERCHRHGQANDLQRYRCCACGRTFNDLTGTPLARL
ncbi:transposase, partial [Massilia timonae]